MIKVKCLGAAGHVTGSNFLVENAQGSKMLVDCGLFQGGADADNLNRGDWGFDPGEIETLVLTHAHIDHSGRIPKLVRDGFRGRIITTPPTTDLCELMLLDSAHVQEMEAEWKTRKNRRKAKAEIEPLYTEADALESLKYFTPTERDRVVELKEGFRIRLRNAGHILGSSILELWAEENGKDTKIVFSGDLGQQEQLIVKDPEEITDTDYLFIESTYGDRLHKDFEGSKAELLEAIMYAVSNNEKVIIPAFALERSQELLYLLGEFSRSGKLPDIPIFLDSPLAIKATEVFRKHKKYYDEEARAIVDEGFDPFDMPNLKLTLSASQSMEINELKGSAIIISASGMCTAGRIKHHLKHNIWRDGASVVIAGFQAQGTTGRQIVDGAARITLFGEKVAVKAKVFTIGGFSAHADQKDLLRWIGRFAENSRPRVFTIHGEQGVCLSFAKAIREKYALEVVVPKRAEELLLDPVEGVKEVIPEIRPDEMERKARALTKELEEGLQSLKTRVGAGEFSKTELQRLREISDDLKALAGK
jgi:metallo-beta-lactamase family protein